MLSGRIKVLLPVVVLFLAFLSTTTALAHGVKIEYAINMSVEIIATYDSGDPMAEAHITIYAPNDLENPWLTSTTDDGGRFTFTPDPAIPGTWDVQVRQAGHGDIIHIPVGEGLLSTGSTGFTSMQIILMSISVIWGFVGTALFFSRRKA
jgi:nickel transport protein